MKKYFLPLALVIASFFLCGAGKFCGDPLRGTFLACVTPFWKAVGSTKGAIDSLFIKERIPEGANAKVIYRSPSLWHSSLWINVGKSHPDVQINSPVVKGNSLIGVVDYVGTHQARVRLITDRGLNPSVRVARGDFQKLKIQEDLKMLIEDLHAIGEAPPKELLSLLQKYPLEGEKWLLAKGELGGSSHPIWKKGGQTLKGVGFNLDFGDQYSGPRDLRTGELQGSGDKIALIQPQDLLITTGLDGVFPEGLWVARVEEIDPLQEGDYYYNLRAKPTAGNLDELKYVTVLPSSGFDPQDLPPTLRRR